ncbi:MAG: hypothetical protein P8174_03015 [Gemmatimonadota bacterium]
MRKLTVTLLGAFVLFGATSLAAQTATATVTVPMILSISLTGNSFDFGPTQTDFDADSMAAGGTSVLSTRGNVPHEIDITADAASFTFTQNTTYPYSDPSKPASDLHWSTGSGWTPLSTAATPVVQNLARGAHATAATVSYYLMLSYANDVPGTYALNFTYTVVPN